jgi:putative endonuclease
MTNQAHRVLYTGVTTDLAKRVREHKEGGGAAFTKKYNAKKLVYFEILDDIREAITREKQIKKGSRRKKIDLIKAKNPSWRDLYDDLL